MISDSLSSYRSQIGNHAHRLRPRDSKLADECVYSLIPILLLILKLSANEYLATGPAREYLDPSGNKGSHSIYFFILKQCKPKCNLPAKIKGREDPSAATYAKTYNLAPTSQSCYKSIENTSTQLRDPRRKCPDFAFPAQKQRVPKTKGKTPALD